MDSTFAHPTTHEQACPDITSADHTAGPAAAPVTLVEYGDYQCPPCGEAAPIVKRLQKHFGSKLRFVFRNFPLEMHPNAQHAAEAAEFAAATSDAKFWEMHDAIYKQQDKLDDKSLLALATKLHLSAEQLAKALEEGTYGARVQRDLDSGIKAGVGGTPSFFINGRLYEESFDYDSLLEAIQSTVERAK